MAYIFLDESGDLGFNFSKKKTSKFFVISFLFVKQKGPLEKIIRKIFRTMSAKEIKFHHGVLHAFHETPKTRMKFLQMLAQQDIGIISIYLNKKKVYTRLQNEKHIIYNYVTNILLDRVCTKKLIPLTPPIVLIASKRETNKFLNQNFKEYLRHQLNSRHKLKIEIEIKHGSQERCLQAVDFICWAVYRKYETGDETYYNLIKSKIIEENGLFT